MVAMGVRIKSSPLYILGFQGWHMSEEVLPGNLLVFLRTSILQYYREDLLNRMKFSLHCRMFSNVSMTRLVLTAGKEYQLSASVRMVTLSKVGSITGEPRKCPGFGQHKADLTTAEKIVRPTVLQTNIPPLPGRITTSCDCPVL